MVAIKACLKGLSCSRSLVVILTKAAAIGLGIYDGWVEYEGSRGTIHRSYSRRKLETGSMAMGPSRKVLSAVKQYHKQRVVSAPVDGSLVRLSHKMFPWRHVPAR